MFRDGFYSAGEGLEAFSFGVNLRGGKTATNFGLNLARKFDVGLPNPHKFNADI